MAKTAPIVLAIANRISSRCETHCAAETVAAYRRDLGLFREYLSQSDQQLSGSSLASYQGWLVRRHAGPLSTLRRRLSAVRSFLRFVYEQGITVSDLSEAVELPSVSQTPPARPEGEDVLSLLVAPDPGSFIGARDRVMLQLITPCGLRPREVCGLAISDYASEASVLCVRGRRRGRVRLPKEAQADLASYVSIYAPALQGPLFPSRKGGALTPRGLVQRIKHYHQQMQAGPSGPVTASHLRDWAGIAEQGGTRQAASDCP